jgi:23S rRNA (uridine2552-2'-O)-methyltransferase
VSPMTTNPYQRPDAYSRAAKKQGFPARSVFKLEEIDRRVGLLRPGQRVLDLGAAPGSWSLYAAQRVGRDGLVVAVDQQPLAAGIGGGRFIRADVMAEATLAQLRRLAPFDVVLSDMAPSTTGTSIVDQARSMELFVRALEVADAVSRPSSAFVGKLFMSADFSTAAEAVRHRYQKLRTIRPRGSRASSSELFLVGVARRDAA